MTVHENVLKAFDGTLDVQPLSIRVKYAGKEHYIYVGLGEIRIPLLKEIREDVLKDIGDKYACSISRTGSIYIVVPRVVDEILEKDGFLASFCDEHREKLREWMLNYGVDVLRELLVD